MAGGPFLAEVNIRPHLLNVRHLVFQILKEGIELKADIAVVALRPFPDRKKDFLGALYQQIGEEPRDLLIAFARTRELCKLAVKAAGLDEIRQDDGIARGTRCTCRIVAANKIG